MMLIEHTPKRWAEFVRTRTPILESIIPFNSKGQRNWQLVGDDTLVAHVEWKIQYEKLGGRYRLVKGDSGLYQVLLRRKLLDEVGLQSSKKGDRNWAGMKRDELIAYAKVFIADSGITGRRELQNIDGGLYAALLKRDLLDDVGLSNSKKNDRCWTGMGKVELIAHAKRFMEERRIRDRGELRGTDQGLYLALGRRNLLDAVFSDVESSSHKEAVDGVLDAVETFGD